MRRRYLGLVSTKSRAVFFDRDGTLIEHVHYLSRLEQIRLMPGVARALKDIEFMGYKRIVVTNQAAIAKGHLNVEGLRAIQAELTKQLAADGAHIDDWYFCPLAGSADRERVEHADRKPGPGMLLKAAAEHNIDLAGSFMVGDMISDALAGKNAGCAASILVGEQSLDLARHPAVDHYLPTIADLPTLLRQLHK